MKRFAAVVCIALVVPVAVLYAQTEPTIRVSVDIHSTDSYGNTLSHHLKNQLRAHPDVFVTDAAPDYVLMVTMMPVRNHEGETQGAVCSAIALGCAEMEDGGEVRLYFGDSIFTTPLDGIQTIAESIAAWFNDGVLNAVREKHRL